MTNLPEFIPSLDERQSAEFLEHTLTLLAFPIQHDAAAHHALAWRFNAPELPRETDLPLLPAKHYPRIDRAIAEATLKLLLPPPPLPDFTGRRVELDRAVMALLAGRSVAISGTAGIGKTAFLRTIAHDSRIRKQFRRVWWLEDSADMGDAIGLALESLPILQRNVDEQPAIAAQILKEANILLLVDDASDPGYALKFGAVAAVGDHPDAIKLEGLPGEAAAALSGLENSPFLAKIGGNPRALRLLRAMIEEDGLSLDETAHLIKSTDPLGDLAEASWWALPKDYQKLIESLPDQSIPIENVINHVGNPLSARRAIRFLEQRGFVNVEGERIRRAIPQHIEPSADMISVPELPYADFRKQDESSDEDDPRTQANKLYAQGNQAIDENRIEDAEKLLSEAFELRKTCDHAHAVAQSLTAIARLQYLQGKDSSAIKNLEASGELLHELRDQSSLDVVRLALSRVYRRVGRLEAAAEVLPEPLPADDYSMICLLQNRHEAALEAAQTEPEPRIRRRLVARILNHMGRTAETLEVLKHDDDFTARHLRAQVYHIQGDFEKAIKAYEKADELGIPDAERGIFARGRARALAAAGQVREAGMIAGAEGLWYESKLPHVSFARKSASFALLGALLLVQGNVEEAEANALQALHAEGERITPEIIAIAQHILGQIYLDRGDIAAALAAFQAELEAREGSRVRDETAIGMTLHTLGDVQAEHGDLERAIGLYRRALTHIDDLDTRLILLLSLRNALLQANRAPDALEAGQQAIDLLLKQSTPELTTLGYVMALQAKTQAQYARTTRAVQLLQDWETRLARRANEAFNHSEWGVQALWIGLVVRSVRPDQYPPALLRDLADEALSVTEQHAPETWVAWAARRDLANLQIAFKEYPEALETIRPLTLVEDRQSNLHIRLPAHAQMGRLLLTLNRPGESLPYLKEAIDLEHDPILRGRLMRELGQAQTAAGNPTAAAEILSESLSFVTRADALDDHVAALVDLGYARLSLQRFNEAIETFEKALDIVQELPDKALMASVLTDLANAHFTLGQYRRAATTYRRALGYQKQPEQIAQTYIALARSSAAMGAYPAALDAYQSALEYPHSPLMQRTLISEQAAIYVNQKRPNEAIAFYQQALGIEGATPTEIAAIRRSLGQLYAGVGQHEQAREHFEGALSAVEDEQSGLTMLAIAEGHRAQNQTTQAIEAYARSLEHLNRSEYPLERALVLRTMGEIYLMEGRAAEALEALEGALEIERTQPRQDGGRIVSILNHIAEANELRGELDKAAVRYHQALVYQDARHAPEGYAGTLRTLGRIYTTMCRFDDAAKALEEALGTEYTQPTQDALAIDETTKMLADVYRAQGRLDEAAQLYRKVTADAPEPIRAGVQAALTNTLSEISRYENTLKAAEQSWQLLNRTGAELKELLFILALEAQTYYAMGRHDESEDFLERFMVMLQKRRKEITPGSKDPAIRALAFMLEGQSAEDAKDLPRAINAYREGLTLAESNRLPPALVWALRQKIGR